MCHFKQCVLYTCKRRLQCSKCLYVYKGHSLNQQQTPVSPVTSLPSACHACAGQHERHSTLCQDSISTTPERDAQMICRPGWPTPAGSSTRCKHLKQQQHRPYVHMQHAWLMHAVLERAGPPQKTSGFWQCCQGTQFIVDDCPTWHCCLKHHNLLQMMQATACRDAHSRTCCERMYAATMQPFSKQLSDVWPSDVVGVTTSTDMRTSILRLHATCRPAH